MINKSGTFSVNSFLRNIKGDFIGGTAAMLVALPSTIAYGILSFAPLGAKFSAMAAIGAILGFIIFNIIAPLISSKKVLASAPNSPAAAVISLFVAEMMNKGSIPPEIIPIYVTLLTVFAGVIQIVMGNFGGGKFIKYIPYPVITGYIMGASIQILLGQLPKILGLPKGMKWKEGILLFDHWKWESICIGIVTMLALTLSKKYLRNIPPVITGLLAGVITYFLISLANPALLNTAGNNFIVGDLANSTSDILKTITNRWSLIPYINIVTLSHVIVPGLTLTILLSFTTLNTCLVLDTISNTTHSPKRELIAQGFGNISAALMGGIPAAGHTNSTLEIIHGGGKTKKSVLFIGINSLLVLLFASQFLSFLPLASLGGILILLAARSIDLKLLNMLKNKSTILDFIVIVTVVVAAINLDLIKGAGVGIGMAIFLFLRQQMNVSVIRRQIFGNQVFSKKLRIDLERKTLEAKGAQTLIIELQGQLFFGTTDQLYSNLETYYATCKFIILDLKRIQSVDYTAANMLKKILTRIKEKNGYLIFTYIPDTLPTGLNMKKYFENVGLFQHDNLKIFDNTDDAMEWVEDQILISENLHIFKDHDVLDLHEIELLEGFPDAEIETMLACLAAKTYQPNEYIFRAGEVSDEIYFVRKGTIKIVLPLSEGKTFHILTIGKGGIFGEMAFIDNVRRSADALALEEVCLFILSRQMFVQITQIHPEIAGKFYQRLAFLSVRRLRQSNKELKVFQEN